MTVLGYIHQKQRGVGLPPKGQHQVLPYVVDQTHLFLGNLAATTSAVTPTSPPSFPHTPARVISTPLAS